MSRFALLKVQVDYDVDKLYFRPVSRCLGGSPAHAPLMSYERQYLANYRAAGVRTLQWTVYLEGHEPSFRAMAPRSPAESGPE